MVLPKCKTCFYWHPQSGVCLNRAAPYGGDIMEWDRGCIKYWRNMHQKCGGILEARTHGDVVEHYCYGCMFTVLIDGEPIKETREWLL